MNTRPDPFLLQPLPLEPLLLRPARRQSRPLGQILVEQGDLSPSDLIKASAMSAPDQTGLADVLLANDMVSETGLFRGLARKYNCELADLAATPPDGRLIDEIGPQRCLRDGIIPWKRVGGATIFVTSRPQDFSLLQRPLAARFGHVLMAVAPESAVQAALLRLRQRPLARGAETRVALDESCRNWQPGAMARVVASALLILLAGLIAAPATTFLILCGWAILTLILNTGLKAAAAIAMLGSARPRRLRFQSSRNDAALHQPPIVSIMVPLFNERAIAGRLVRRLARLTYPKELLDICLVVEQDDTVTRARLDSAGLPQWMRQIVVPAGSFKTKPRALNYALDFCHGSIIGVYDAEDAPEPDQIHKVVRRFQECDPKVACLQGVLDFYNPRENWLSRCFTIEYATWFRVILPGLQRLKFAIPLGGTSLFFRREILEELGGWDAHNVTEDADLGIRLARHGYYTELLATVTREEANCHLWPWIRQRSRWLKGYAMTWAVHMRAPRRLLSEIGPWRFFGVQLLFVGTLSQFLLAPLLWSFWALPLGLPHPLDDILSWQGFVILTAIFMSCEVISLAVATFAVADNRHRRMWPWVPTMHLYFPLGAAAAYKAFWEMIVKPHYWDKTAHGVVRGGTGKVSRKRRKGASRAHSPRRP